MHVIKSAAIFRRNKKWSFHLLHTQSKNKQTNQNMLNVHKNIFPCVKKIKFQNYAFTHQHFQFLYNIPDVVSTTITHHQLFIFVQNFINLVKIFLRHHFNRKLYFMLLLHLCYEMLMFSFQSFATEQNLIFFCPKRVFIISV